MHTRTATGVKTNAWLNITWFVDQNCITAVAFEISAKKNTVVYTYTLYFSKQWVYKNGLFIIYAWKA